MYEVFAVYYTPETSDVTYTFDFNSDEDFLQYLATSRSSSLYETDCRELTAQDKVITLSTCTKTDPDKRLIVQLVRGDEVFDEIIN